MITDKTENPEAEKIQSAPEPPTARDLARAIYLHCSTDGEFDADEYRRILAFVSEWRA